MVLHQLFAIVLLPFLHSHVDKNGEAKHMLTALCEARGLSEATQLLDLQRE